jgi:hypothetical protein
MTTINKIDSETLEMTSENKTTINRTQLLELKASHEEQLADINSKLAILK